MSELWECSDCLKVGPLDVHGHCSRCGSDAVISQHARETFKEIGPTSWAWQTPRLNPGHQTIFPADSRNANRNIPKSWWVWSRPE
jgi:hypothetical protein